MCRLVVLVPLALSLGRVVPRFTEQELVVDDGAQDGIRDRRASFDREDGVLGRGREFVERIKTSDRDEDRRQDGRPARRSAQEARANAREGEVASESRLEARNALLGSDRAFREGWCL